MHDFNKTLSIMAECAFRSGFVILPGPATSPSPSSWDTASGSAVFFTLTIGALSYSAGDFCSVFFCGWFRSLKTRFSASACFILGISCLLYFTGMPFVFPVCFLITGVLAVFLRLFYFKGHEFRKRMEVILICFAAIALFLFSIQGSGKGIGFFTGVRDRVLFGTAAGERIIDFYYKHNLYGAEVIKKPESRIVRAVSAGETDQATVFDDIKSAFERKGFAFVKGNGCRAFYEVSLKNGVVGISSGKKIVYSAGIDKLKSDPTGFFKNFYLKSDNAEYLRFMVFISFCFGIPFIFLGQLADSFIQFPGTFSKKKTLIIMLILISMSASFVYIQSREKKYPDHNELNKMLKSGDNEQRIYAMGLILKMKMDPDGFAMPDVFPGKGAPRERILYLYLASRIGGNDKFETISPFVEDPYPYVSCQAIRFLSQLGDSRSAPVFEKILRTHSNIYVQLTAMEALKSWKNRKNQ